MKKRWLAMSLVFALVLSLCGCTARSIQNTGDGSAQTEPRSVEGSADHSAAEHSENASALVSAPVQYPELPRDYEERWKVLEDNPVEEDFLRGMNLFAQQTTRQVLGEEGGCWSPLSLYYALALAAEGAQGETQSQLLTLLGTDAEKLGEQCGHLFRRLYADSEEGTLLVANSLWMDDEVGGIPVRFREEYLKKAGEQYFSSLFTVDFSDSATGGKIGDWVEENTRKKLRFEPEANDAQILAILNAIYYKSAWVDAFSENQTKPDTFRRSDGTEQTADFLHQTRNGICVNGDGYLFASLPLTDGAQMNFCLPDEGVDLRGLLEDPKLFAAPDRSQGKECELHWSVPKFTQDSHWSPKEALETLGVTTAFTGDADFSGMTDAAACITDIQQGTHIGVDENGVEAAAYTYISMETTGALPEELEVVEMNLNRPFFYTITTEDGVVVFAGIVESVE